MSVDTPHCESVPQRGWSLDCAVMRSSVRGSGRVEERIVTIVSCSAAPALVENLEQWAVARECGDCAGCGIHIPPPAARHRMLSPTPCHSATLTSGQSVCVVARWCTGTPCGNRDAFKGEPSEPFGNTGCMLVWANGLVWCDARFAHSITFPLGGDIITHPRTSCHALLAIVSLCCHL